MRDLFTRGRRAAIGGLAAAVVGATLASIAGPMPASATTPGGNGRIVYRHDSRTTNEVQLRTVNADGTGVQTILTRGSAFSPAWSPDGRQIAFSGWKTGLSGQSDIWIVDADGTDLTNITNTNSDSQPGANRIHEEQPSWSPSGEELAVKYSEFGPVGSPQQDTQLSAGLMILEADGTLVSKIDLRPSVGFLAGIGLENGLPTWSPDGERLAFAGYSSENGQDIFVVDRDGTGLTQLTTAAGNQTHPDWSPDGTKILYDTGATFATIPAAGGTPSPISVTCGGAACSNGSEHPAWSPDGSRIVFRGWPSASNSFLYSVTASGTGSQQLTSADGTNGWDLDPAWQPSVPSNDFLGNAENLGSNRSVTFSGATNVNATREPGEPAHGGLTTGRPSVWFTWTAPYTGAATVDTVGSTFDTLLSVYRSTSATPSMTSLVAPAVGENNDITSNSNLQSRTSFAVTQGTTYAIAVDGRNAATGSVTMRVNPPPANDDFAGGIVLAGANPIASGTNAGATKEAGEPDHVTSNGGRSVWYRWQAPANGTAVVDTSGSTIDTLLAVYTGGAVTALTPIASDDDGGAGLASRASFPVTGGTIYHVAIDGYQGAEGVIAVAVNPAAGNDSFDGATTIIGASGSTNGTTVGATHEGGTDPMHSSSTGWGDIWYRWTAPENGIVVLDTQGSTFDTKLAVYTGATYASRVEVTSNDNAASFHQLATGRSRVQFNATAGTTYSIAIDGWKQCTGCTEQRGSTVLRMNPAPGNDTFGSPRTISGESSSGEEDWVNVGGTREAGEPNHAGAPGGGSGWFSWTAPSTGVYRFDTSDSRFDTVLAVYTGSAVNGLTGVASNDDAPEFSTDRRPWASAASFAATGGTTYKIAVDGANGARGQYFLNWSKVPPQTTIIAGSAPVTSDPDGSVLYIADHPAATYQCAIHAASFSGTPSYASCPKNGVSGAQTFPGLADGSWTAYVRATVGGLTDPTPATRTFVVDTVGPTTTITGGPAGEVTGTEATFTLGSNEDPEVRYECELDGEALDCPTTQTTPGGELVNRLELTVGPGPHQLVVTAVDGADNADPSPATRAWTVGDGPAISVGDAQVKEGQPGATKPLAFPVTLSGASSDPVSIDYVVETQSAKSPADFVLPSGGTIEFEPEDTSEQVTVTVKGDAFDEANETLVVRLLPETVEQGYVTDAVGVGTIKDDDATPSVGFVSTRRQPAGGDRKVTEGAKRTTTSMTFKVKLSAASGRRVEVPYGTSDGTAKGTFGGGTDYKTTGGMLVLEPGTRSLSVPIKVFGDNAKEPKETFTVDLGPPTNAKLADASATGTIIDDDD